MENFVSRATFSRFALLCFAHLHGEIEYLQQPDKSPLHLLLLSCFITYRKMNRNNQEPAQIGGE